MAKLKTQPTKAKARMWGSAILGFGDRKLTYADGSESDWMRIAFSPRKDKIALYLAPFEGKDELLDKLGKHQGSEACVHIRRMSDVDLTVLEKLIKVSVKSAWFTLVG